MSNLNHNIGEGIGCILVAIAICIIMFGIYAVINKDFLMELVK